MQIAKRMEPLKGVLVMEMNMRLAKMKQEGRDVVNLGVGDPDFNPPEHILPKQPFTSGPECRRDILLKTSVLRLWKKPTYG